MTDPLPTAEHERACEAAASEPCLRTTRVLVVGDQVVADAVRVALGGLGLSAVSATWRSLLRTGAALVPARVLAAVDVGLLLSDLDTDSRVENAQQVLAGVSLPWLVLTGAPRGPLWGAVLRHDAQVVRSSSTRLAELVDLLGDLQDGVADPSGPERDDMTAAWEELWRARVDLGDRLRSLSPREGEVLRLLYRGEPVTRIAHQFGVADSTVRSQVKSMLRKLGVSSQLGAVAAYGMLRSARASGDLEAGAAPRGPQDVTIRTRRVATYPAPPVIAPPSSVLSSRPAPPVR